MAITTLDQVIAGMQPPQHIQKAAAPGVGVAARFWSPFYAAGQPGAAAAPAPGVAGAALTSYAGQIPFVNGAADQYLARFAANSNFVGTLLLCDRLWHNSGLSVTLTTAQTVNSVAWPARDANASINGEGVYIGLEVSTIMGAGAPTLSIGYTNQAGTAGKIGNGRLTVVTASMVGSFYDFSLAAGDTGVRSIQTYTASATMTSGAIHLVAYRVLARVAVPVAGAEYAIDALTSGMPKLHDNTVPFLLWLPATANTVTLGGQLVQSNG